ncbi:unnamed protein product [Caenorhabditis nigoni]
MMNKLGGGGQLLPEGPRDVKSFRQLIIRIGAFYVDDDDQHDEESSLKTKPKRFLVLQVIWPFVEIMRVDWSGQYLLLTVHLVWLRHPGEGERRN